MCTPYQGAAAAHVLLFAHKNFVRLLFLLCCSVLFALILVLSLNVERRNNRSDALKMYIFYVEIS